MTIPRAKGIGRIPQLISHRLRRKIKSTIQPGWRRPTGEVAPFSRANEPELPGIHHH